MNCSPTIAIAVLLLALTAGMFLLYKTNKENLGIFFKIVSWFIIVVALGSLICCSVCCLKRCCGPRQECSKMDRCEMGGGHGNFNKRVMILKGDGGACEVTCEMEGKGCCKEKEGCAEGKAGCEEEKEGCCKKGGAEGCEKEVEKKCEIETKKDTVVVKKK